MSTITVQHIQLRRHLVSSPVTAQLHPYSNTAHQTRSSMITHHPPPQAHNRHRQK
ncbi:uncharacterized protein CC84DRAFT_1161776 [Paraphaeosphaeria sporulosa]|uniref:Uncharacterized protein n=1 Tax=Paraphaeosphaeria sporulosa TaxID=1460663 RepID=A0A177CTX3_9PLEO|nr:uncharacterized protein CC84DRAFT_1161776 [Paraphaeosphaeria sporulosa]OAG10974.1 hypothetical protein CC84DRAFT_1161776 [Paraphaeosphaeria sporulosa]